MTIPSDPQFEQLSRTDPIALVRALFAQVDALKNEVVALREEIERLKGPKANSQNSSQAPSLDQKPNIATGKPKRKHGPPFGHKRSVRKLIDNPTVVIPVGVNQCESCHHDSGKNDGARGSFLPTLISPVSNCVRCSSK